MPALYSVKVALRGVTPMIWRRLRLEGSTSLAALHFILQKSFGWDDEHLHRFHIHGKDFGICWDGGLHFDEDAFQVRLDDFGFEVSDRFTYEYNFYAEWLLDIRIEAIEEQPSRKQAPFCFSGAGMLGATAIDVFEKTMDLLKLIVADDESITVGDVRCRIEALDAVRFNRHTLNHHIAALDLEAPLLENGYT